jgi:hypothetical protein
VCVDSCSLCAYAASAVLVALLTRVVGGHARGPLQEHHPFSRIATLVPNMLTFATSTRIFKHFWQMRQHRRFEAYDYGAEHNLLRYGSRTPLDCAYARACVRACDVCYNLDMAHYDVIDIPVYFCMGKRAM